MTVLISLLFYCVFTLRFYSSHFAGLPTLPCVRANLSYPIFSIANSRTTKSRTLKMLTTGLLCLSAVSWVPRWAFTTSRRRRPSLTARPPRLSQHTIVCMPWALSCRTPHGLLSCAAPTPGALGCPKAPYIIVSVRTFSASDSQVRHVSVKTTNVVASMCLRL
jgi:hypothetical protein